uniref:Myeloid leukemia factor n=1 Tax=Chromera velia CCMP2878 TaxID=1169474 RepID=A0A0G4F9N7_9ALVE|eukprot:Cvel_15794.t1-p1 / transcript=Cvel_15794.t1 / gene=Cvel_15794 / organism=Chromera_velia_CCMP2878 / gene_product=Myeloid leukemia factor, putative / transcript_product=Myeloid leukemia factor, putative / location=Cvel_scaffold1185:38827-41320(+) / protein_length=399 / sequence_SO=supercontig / SO=protein_coding / is_pseudo=false
MQSESPFESMDRAMTEMMARHSTLMESFGNPLSTSPLQMMTALPGRLGGSSLPRTDPRGVRERDSTHAQARPSLGMAAFPFTSDLMSLSGGGFGSMQGGGRERERRTSIDDLMRSFGDPTATFSGLFDGGSTGGRGQKDAIGKLPVGPSGQYSCSMMSMASCVGPDGKPKVEKFAQSSVGNLQQRAYETQQAYTNTGTGVDRMALERGVGERARKVIRERNRNTGDEKEHRLFKGLDETAAADFDSKFSTIRGTLPRHTLQDAAGLPSGGSLSHSIRRPSLNDYGHSQVSQSRRPSLPPSVQQSGRQTPNHAPHPFQNSHRNPPLGSGGFGENSRKTPQGIGSPSLPSHHLQQQQSYPRGGSRTPAGSVGAGRFVGGRGGGGGDTQAVLKGALQGEGRR